MQKSARPVVSGRSHADPIEWARRAGGIKIAVYATVAGVLLQLSGVIFPQPTYTPLASWDMEQGTLGARPAGWTSSDDVIVEGELAYSGSRAWKNDIPQGTDGWGVWGGVYALPEPLVRGDEIWIRVRTFFPSGFDYDSTGGGNKLKFLRVHTATKDGVHVGYDDIEIEPKDSNPHVYVFGFEGNPGWYNIGTSPDDDIVLNKWETYEWYMYFDNVAVENGGRARVRFWKNGTLLADITNKTTLRSATDQANAFYYLTYWNGNAPQTQSMYTDDIEIATSRVSRPQHLDASGNAYIGM